MSGKSGRNGKNMAILVEIRERLKEFYTQFSGVLNICGKFLLAMLVFLMINRTIGFNPIFTNIFVILVMALISSVLSGKILALLCAVMILGHSYTLGLDILAASAVVILLLYLLFLIYVPEETIGVVLMPLAMALGVPALIPITFGIRRTPASIAALCPGVVMHYYIQMLSDKAGALQGTSRSDYATRLKLVVEEAFGSRMMIMNLFAVAAVVIVVYAIRKLRADYSYEIAVAAGGVLYIVMAVISNMALDIGLGMGGLIIGTVIAVALAYFFLYLVHFVDYSRAENLSFEDDEYFYYVKAIPKYSIERAERTTKSITGDDYAETGEIPAVPQEEPEPLLQRSVEGVDFEERLENSLKDL